MTATLQVIHRFGEDRERLDRFVSALDELAGALELDRPPQADIGGNYSFYGMTATELRAKLPTVQTDTRGLFSGVTDDED